MSNFLPVRHAARPWAGLLSGLADVNGLSYGDYSHSHTLLGHSFDIYTFNERRIMSYADDVQTKLNDCTEPVRDRPDMVANRGGGFGFKVSDLAQLKRFLILGHEGGTYYADQRTLSLESVDCIDRLLVVDPTGCLVVYAIVEISTGGRAPNNNPAIFALAYVASKVGTPASFKALEHLSDVCRIGTHLFDFLNYSKTLGRGWGSAFKRAVAKWYDRDPLSLARQVTKYAQRNGWSHRDVLRKCHFSTDNFDLNQVLQYVTQKEARYNNSTTSTPAQKFLTAVDFCYLPDVKNNWKTGLIRQHGLVREQLSTSMLNDPEVWEALLTKMPLTAMIRNLGKMSSIGLIKPLSDASKDVVKALQNTAELKRQRVHPITLLKALKIYEIGHGFRGSLQWLPDQQILAALDDVFYESFENVKPTGKRLLLGVDISGSMTAPCIGSEILTCREAAVVMAMLAARTESQTFICGFSTSFVDLGITEKDSLRTAINKTMHLPFARTRIAVPMEFAKNNALKVDAFCIYTDNETNRGPNPFQALKDYRQVSGIPAKLAVFGLAHSQFTIADPTDSGTMDFVGFDSAAPALLADFIR